MRCSGLQRSFALAFQEVEGFRIRLLNPFFEMGGWTSKGTREILLNQKVETSRSRGTIANQSHNQVEEKR